MPMDFFFCHNTIFDMKYIVFLERKICFQYPASFLSFRCMVFSCFSLGIGMFCREGVKWRRLIKGDNNTKNKKIPQWTCKMRNETRNEIYRNGTKRNETQRNLPKRNGTERNKMKCTQKLERNAIQRNEYTETEQNRICRNIHACSKPDMDDHWS